MGKVLPHFSGEETKAREVTGHVSSKKQGLAWTTSHPKPSQHNFPFRFHIHCAVPKPRWFSSANWSDLMQCPDCCAQLVLEVGREKPRKEKGTPSACARRVGKGEEFAAIPLPLCSYSEQHFGSGTRLTVLGKKGGRVGCPASKPP